MSLLSNKTAFKLLCIFITGVCCFSKVEAQTYPVTSIVNLNSGTLPYLEDFIRENPMQLTHTLILNDDDFENIDVGLRIRIFGEGINIYTDPEYIGSLVSLSFNVPKTLTGFDLSDYFNPDNLIFQGITKEQFLQGGKMPEGFYNICIEAVDPFRFDENAVSNLSCAPAVLEVHKPPTLVSLIGEQIFLPSPNYYFDWIDNHIGFNANYNLLIYEKALGMTNDEVLDFISPIVIELDQNSDQYLYSAIDPYLYPNQKYLVRVQAFDPLGQESFENNGFSNVEQFFLAEDCLLDADNDGVCDDIDKCHGQDDNIDLDQNGIPDCLEDETTCIFGESCDDGLACTTNDIIIDEDCNCKGTLLPDSDNDGICDLEDNCPGLDDTADDNGNQIPDCLEENNDCTIGILCDDGDPCTYYDLIVGPDCLCQGTATKDSDNDGVCDVIDQCPGQDDSIDLNNNGVPDCFESDCIIASPCDDGDPCTYFDVIYGENCDCAGTPSPDSDNDGVCDAEDQCPGQDDTIDLNQNGVEDCSEQNCSQGALCDDGDPCTVFDVITGKNCYCEGTPVPDDDNDGICNLLDVCPGQDDTIDLNQNGIPDCNEQNCEIGALCNDGDPCTVFDLIQDEFCNCAGTPAPDSDGDGVCDILDQCEGHNDAIDINNNGIPDACDTAPCVLGASCDDGDPCTINDVIVTLPCNCAGKIQDSDGDSVSDCDDKCPGGDDYMDLDGNGVPDFCDCQVGSPCDDGLSNTINDVIGADCNCNGMLLNTPVALEATNIDTSSLQFTAHWESMPQVSDYYLTVATSTSFDPSTIVSGYDAVFVQSLNLTVTGTASDSTYYYKLTAMIGGNMTGWSNIITVNFGNECAPGSPPPYDCLAVDPAFADVTNMNLRNQLKVGDQIWAADFMIEITEVSGGGAPWSGKGQMSIPLTDKRGKVNVNFNNVYVNTECRLVGEGYMDVTGIGAQIISQEMSEFIHDIVGYLELVDGALQSLENTLGAVNNALNQLDSISNYFSEGVGFEIATDGSKFITDEYPYLPADVTQDVEAAIDCFSDSFLNGSNMEDCNEDFGEAINNMVNAIENMYAAEQQVNFFEDPLMHDGLDSIQNEAFAPEYNQFKIAGEDYTVSWKSIERGTDEPVKAKMADGSLFPSYLRFEDNLKTAIPATGTAVKNLSLQAPLETGTTQVYAIEEATTDRVKIAGKLNLVTYDKDAIDVVIVPVKGNTNPTINHPFISNLALEEAIQNIFSPAVVQINLTVENPLNVSDFDDSMDDFQSSPANKYSSEQENIINSLVNPDEEIYYIFLVNTYEGATLGMMPHGSHYGFVYHQNNLNTALDDEEQYTKTIAHELGHGAFKLRHSFDTWNETSKGATDNLMDYSAGTNLIKPQWDKVHDPELLIGVFEGGEDDNEISSVYFDITCIPREAISVKEHKYFYTPDGKKIKLGVNQIPMSVMTDNKTANFAEQSITSFLSDGEEYFAVFVLNDQGVAVFKGYQKESEPHPGEMSASERQSAFVRMRIMLNEMIIEDFEIPSGQSAWFVDVKKPTSDTRNVFVDNVLIYNDLDDDCEPSVKVYHKITTQCIPLDAMNAIAERNFIAPNGDAIQLQTGDIPTHILVSDEEGNFIGNTLFSFDRGNVKYSACFIFKEDGDKEFKGYVENLSVPDTEQAMNILSSISSSSGIGNLIEINQHPQIQSKCDVLLNGVISDGYIDMTCLEFEPIAGIFQEECIPEEITEITEHKYFIAPDGKLLELGADDEPWQFLNSDVLERGSLYSFIREGELFKAVFQPEGTANFMGYARDEDDDPVSVLNNVTISSMPSNAISKSVIINRNNDIPCQVWINFTPFSKDINDCECKSEPIIDEYFKNIQVNFISYQEPNARWKNIELVFDKLAKAEDYIISIKKPSSGWENANLSEIPPDFITGSGNSFTVQIDRNPELGDLKLYKNSFDSQVSSNNAVLDIKITPVFKDFEGNAIFPFNVEFQSGNFAYKDFIVCGSSNPIELGVAYQFNQNCQDDSKFEPVNPTNYTFNWNAGTAYTACSKSYDSKTVVSSNSLNSPFTLTRTHIKKNVFKDDAGASMPIELSGAITETAQIVVKAYQPGDSEYAANCQFYHELLDRTPAVDEDGNAPPRKVVWENGNTIPLQLIRVPLPSDDGVDINTILGGGTFNAGEPIYSAELPPVFIFGNKATASDAQSLNSHLAGQSGNPSASITSFNDQNEYHEYQLGVNAFDGTQNSTVQFVEYKNVARSLNGIYTPIEVVDKVCGGFNRFAEIVKSLSLQTVDLKSINGYKWDCLVDNEVNFITKEKIGSPLVVTSGSGDIGLDLEIGITESLPIPGTPFSMYNKFKDKFPAFIQSFIENTVDVNGLYAQIKVDIEHSLINFDFDQRLEYGDTEPRVEFSSLVDTTKFHDAMSLDLVLVNIYFSGLENVANQNFPSPFWATNTENVYFKVSLNFTGNGYLTKGDNTNDLLDGAFYLDVSADVAYVDSDGKVFLLEEDLSDPSNNRFSRFLSGVSWLRNEGWMDPQSTDVPMPTDIGIARYLIYDFNEEDDNPDEYSKTMQN